VAVRRIVSVVCTTIEPIHAKEDSMSIPISNELFCDFLNCKYKAYLRLTGNSGEQSRFEQMNLGLLKGYRTVASERLLRSQSSGEICEKPQSLRNALEHGYAVITDAHVTVGDIACHFDALMRAAKPPSKSCYFPLLFIHTEKVSKLDKLLLAYCGSILERLQDEEIPFGKIVRGRRFVTSRVDTSSLLPTLNQTVREIADLRRGSDPPPLRLNGHCSICEFGEQCRATAIEKDDLSLLRGLRDKDISKLNAKGIFTVNQFSHTFRPRRRRRKMEYAARKHNWALQARAIRDNTLFIAEKPVSPSKRTQVYLDIEGIPDKDFYYLIGLLISDRDSRSFHSLWADSLDQQHQNWISFLAILNQIEDFDLLHYGKYENCFLRRMRKLYGGDTDLLDRIESCSSNVLSAIHCHLYFPVLSNDLKSIASCLGFKWSTEGASGLESIAWHHEWTASGNTAIKEKLIQYNKEDCLALEAVVAVIQGVCNERVGSDLVPFREVVNTDDLKPEMSYRFQKPQFSFPDLARINECSYFDYQKNRIYLRSKKRRAKSRHARRVTVRKPRVNKVVEHPDPGACDNCHSNRLRVRGKYQKDILDLRFFKGGVKAWNERHKARSYRCETCGQILYPEEYLSVGRETRRGRCRYGDNLHVWSVYNKVALVQSYRQIATGLQEIFGLSLNHDVGYRAMQRAAQQYKTTYLQLIQRLRESEVVHADETWVSITGRSAGRGYIWAFANMENAIYKFSFTREATTPIEMLQGFDGVLVSDFYRAYDSLECVQQKCLIHLIRDMNNDIFKSPFDEELKVVVSSFGVLLRSIVETIDRYGLTKRHLNKHREDVDRYYSGVLGTEFGSERARYYQRRLRAYRDRLFVFLERDGIPWNNNNGENVIKTFVQRRRPNGAFAKDRIDEYLVLLSVYQTLCYRDASFLEFLRSGETDIDKFCSRAG